LKWATSGKKGATGIKRCKEGVEELEPARRVKKGIKKAGRRRKTE